MNLKLEDKPSLETDVHSGQEERTCDRQGQTYQWSSANEKAAC
jgi:hypothetical protein